MTISIRDLSAKGKTSILLAIKLTSEGTPLPPYLSLGLIFLAWNTSFSEVYYLLILPKFQFLFIYVFSTMSLSRGRPVDSGEGAGNCLGMNFSVIQALHRSLFCLGLKYFMGWPFASKIFFLHFFICRNFFLNCHTPPLRCISFSYSYLLRSFMTLL